MLIPSQVEVEELGPGQPGAECQHCSVSRIQLRQTTHGSLSSGSDITEIIHYPHMFGFVLTSTGLAPAPEYKHSSSLAHCLKCLHFTMSGLVYDSYLLHFHNVSRKHRRKNQNQTMQCLQRIFNRNLKTNNSPVSTYPSFMVSICTYYISI